MEKKITIKTLLKIILSGEYFILFNKKAISTTINKNINITMQFIKRKNIIIDSFDLNIFYQYKINEVLELSKIIYSKYLLFLKNNKKIKIFKNPSEIIAYTVNLFLTKNNIVLKNGIKIIIKSKNKKKYKGLGSSASIIINLIINLIYKFKIKIKNKNIIKIAKDIENKQHGFSSAIDINTCFYGNLLNLKKSKNFYKKKLTLINTGEKNLKTNESIIEILNNIKNTNINKDFKKIIIILISMLKNNNNNKIVKYITKYNNIFLFKLKIIPKNIIKFILNLEKKNIIFKLSGAGASFGLNAGILYSKENNKIKKYIKLFNYTKFNIKTHEKILQKIL